MQDVVSRPSDALFHLKGEKIAVYNCPQKKEYGTPNPPNPNTCDVNHTHSKSGGARLQSWTKKPDRKKKPAAPLSQTLLIKG